MTRIFESLFFSAILLAAFTVFSPAANAGGAKLPSKLGITCTIEQSPFCGSWGNDDSRWSSKHGADKGVPHKLVVKSIDEDLSARIIFGWGVSMAHQVRRVGYNNLPAKIEGNVLWTNTTNQRGNSIRLEYTIQDDGTLFGKFGDRATIILRRSGYQE